MDFNTKFRFRKFPVYQEARKFSIELKILATKDFPKEEQFILTAQLLRASLSIILNIAEGSDRSTDKDFAHFLNQAHTSLNEVVSCLDAALDSDYISHAEHVLYLEKAAGLADQITAFRKKLLQSPTK